MAEIKYLVDLDLNGGQLSNAVIQVLGTAPAHAAGRIYYDSGTSKIRWSDGAAWHTAGDVDGVTAGTRMTGGGTSGTVTISLDASTIAEIVASTTHLSNTSNPHSVTKTQVGLGNVDNTSDANKPVSTATQTALDGKVDDAQVLTNVPAGAVFTDTETTTSISFAGNILTYTDEDGIDTDIDLSLYLDDTNLARLTSGTLNGTTGIATFTRDDATTFTIDMSALLDDTSPSDATTTVKGIVELATNGEALAGTDTTRAVTPSGLAARSYRAQIGDGSSTSIAVTHDLGVEEVMVQVYDSATKDTVIAQVVRTSNAVATISFNTAPSANEYSVLITRID